MIQEPDTVVLTHDIDGYDLKRDDTGAVIHRYSEGPAFEVASPVRTRRSPC